MKKKSKGYRYLIFHLILSKICYALAPLTYASCISLAVAAVMTVARSKRQRQWRCTCMARKQPCGGGGGGAILPLSYLETVRGRLALPGCCESFIWSLSPKESSFVTESSFFLPHKSASLYHYHALPRVPCGFPVRGRCDNGGRAW